jgi:hypothetical protein
MEGAEESQTMEEIKTVEVAQNPPSAGCAELLATLYRVTGLRRFSGKYWL